VTVEFVSHGTYCNTLQHTATHCNTLRHTATHCNVVYCESARFPCNCRVRESRNKLQHSATHCNTLQHTATQFTANQRDFYVTVEDSPFYMTIHCVSDFRPFFFYITKQSVSKRYWCDCRCFSFLHDQTLFSSEIFV